MHLYLDQCVSNNLDGGVEQGITLLRVEELSEQQLHRQELVDRAG
jgi:hypothetical protein